MNIFLIIRVDKFWEVAQNRRELLEKFASSKGCDPLLPQFWYNLNPAELSSVKVQLAVLSYSLASFFYSHCF